MKFKDALRLGIACLALGSVIPTFAGAQSLRHHPLPQPQASTPAIIGPAITTVTPAGTWTPLVNLVPEHISNMMLLSDGTVLANGFEDNTWYKLTPDSKGSYANGTWSQMASMAYQRLYYQSDMLPSGKIFVAGGEDGNAPPGSAELYDPVANTWTELPNATSVDPGMNFVDGSSMVLNDGTVLVDAVIGTLCPSHSSTLSTGDMLIFNPADSTWSATGCPIGVEDETTWVKLKDGSILALDINSPTSERYIPSLGKWVADAPPPANLFNQNGELGGAFLLPNGNVFYIGGTNQTLIYTPSGNANPGKWHLGPMLPNQAGVPVGANDAPAAMMANGKILMAAGGYLPPCNYCAPSYFFTYDYLTNKITPVNAPGGGTSLDSPTFTGNMLDLPDGSVLYTSSFPQLYVFTPAGKQVEAGDPRIYTVSKNDDGSYHVTGTGFNGISGGACYGDENQNVTNYPIVRLIDFKGDVYFARTYNWSSTAVATGNEVVSTEMTLPPGLPHGVYLLTVSANGVSSDLSFGSLFIYF
jgi:hypothetical protein